MRFIQSNSLDLSPISIQYRFCLHIIHCRHTFNFQPSTVNLGHSVRPKYRQNTLIINQPIYGLVNKLLLEFNTYLRTIYIYLSSSSIATYDWFFGCGVILSCHVQRSFDPFFFFFSLNCWTKCTTVRVTLYVYNRNHLHGINSTSIGCFFFFLFRQCAYE